MLAGAAALACLLTACRVDTAVTVDLDTDGSGRVAVVMRLDADAASRLDDPTTQILVEDVAAAGWTVEPVARNGDGVRIAATKSFGSEEEFGAVLDELSGDAGIFGPASIGTETTFGREQVTASFEVTTPADLSAFSDEEVAGVLDGEALGQPLDELLADMGDGATAPLTVRLELDDENDEVTFDLLEGSETATLEVVRVIEHDRPRLFVAAGIGAAAAGVLLLLGRAIIRRVRRS